MACIIFDALIWSLFNFSTLSTDLAAYAAAAVVGPAGIWDCTVSVTSTSFPFSVFCSLDNGCRDGGLLRESLGVVDMDEEDGGCFPLLLVDLFG